MSAVTGFSALGAWFCLRFVFLVQLSHRDPFPGLPPGAKGGQVRTSLAKAWTLESGSKDMFLSKLIS